MSCKIPKLKTRESAKPTLKEARDRHKWTVDSQEPLRRASKLLDPHWEEKGGYLYVGVSHESWKFFLYRMRPINAEIFKAYCAVLELKWQDIAEHPEETKTELAAAEASDNSAGFEGNFAGSEGAIVANNLGVELKENSEFVEARKQFELAIKLNPDNAASYYNLAGIYEEAGKLDKAIELYQDAAFCGFAAAYCKLARLYVIEYQDWAKAVEKSRLGLKLIENEKVEAEKILQSVSIVKSALLIYQAWAWNEQGRWKEALENLQAAVKLQSDRGLTYGIMAEVLENMGKKAEALAAWKNCLTYASSSERDEDIWIGKARQRLG